MKAPMMTLGRKLRMRLSGPISLFLDAEQMVQIAGMIANELHPYIFASCFIRRDIVTCRHNNFETGLK
jgi:hypothetical protein